MSKNHDAVKLAYRKGYRVLDDGSVENAEGRPRKLQKFSKVVDSYLRFNISTPEGIYPVAAHKLQAYQKFGESMFAPGILVRHLDGNALNNRPENIALGTSSDDAMDRSDSARQLHAQKCTRGRGKLDEATWELVAEDYAAGMGYKRLRKKYGVGLSTLSYRLSQSSAYRLLEHRGPPQAHIQ